MHGGAGGAGVGIAPDRGTKNSKKTGENRKKDDAASRGESGTAPSPLQSPQNTVVFEVLRMGGGEAGMGLRFFRMPRTPGAISWAPSRIVRNKPPRNAVSLGVSGLLWDPHGISTIPKTVRSDLLSALGDP